MFKDRLFNPIPLAIGLADGWAAAATARKLVIGTVSKGWIFKTATPLTLAGKVAALLGIPAGVASAFIGILAGIGAFFLARRLLKPLIESFFEKRLLRQFDHEAMPELRRWAKGQIALL